MNIDLLFMEDLKEGMLFRIPINSETDEFLSGRIAIYEKDDSLSISTNCMEAKNDINYKLLIIHMAMNHIFKQKTGTNLSDDR